ncbi:MAG: precorrin-6A/cobalt-precorrin-6A reductase [Candidatus Endobugula sp.]|jgi:precorrin-6A/cobalt-precorrin-6A reductase
MTILLLGGTADARHLADRLLKKSVKVIYSVAGLVRTPDMTCEVLVGGFSALGGLAHYVDEKNISMIVDVTHPYAKKITQTAMSVAEEKNIAYVRFHRPAWLPKVGDDWHEVSEWDEVLEKIKHAAAVFLTVGQLSQEQIDSLHQPHSNQQSSQKQVLRTAVKPSAILPASIIWIKAIGPFSYQQELTTIQQYDIDMIVSKNSGGDSTIEKLNVAREKNIPVVMLSRPGVGIPAMFKKTIFDSIEKSEAHIEKISTAMSGDNYDI